MDQDEVGGSLLHLLYSIGLQFTDQHMCWVSSTAQYAHKEVEGTCSHKLQAAPTLLGIGNG